MLECSQTDIWSQHYSPSQRSEEEIHSIQSSTPFSLVCTDCTSIPIQRATFITINYYHFYYIRAPNSTPLFHPYFFFFPCRQHATRLANKPIVLKS